MFHAKPAAEVGVVLETATTAFERCLQALRSGDAQPVRRPLSATAQPPAKS